MVSSEDFPALTPPWHERVLTPWGLKGSNPHAQVHEEEQNKKRSVHLPVLNTCCPLWRFIFPVSLCDGDANTWLIRKVWVVLFGLSESAERLFPGDLNIHVFQFSDFSANISQTKQVNSVYFSFFLVYVSYLLCLLCFIYKILFILFASMICKFFVVVLIICQAWMCYEPNHVFPLSGMNLKCLTEIKRLKYFTPTVCWKFHWGHIWPTGPAAAAVLL